MNNLESTDQKAVMKKAATAIPATITDTPVHIETMKCDAHLGVTPGDFIKPTVHPFYILKEDGYGFIIVPLGEAVQIRRIHGSRWYVLTKDGFGTLERYCDWARVPNPPAA